MMYYVRSEKIPFVFALLLCIMHISKASDVSATSASQSESTEDLSEASTISSTDTSNLEGDCPSLKTTSSEEVFCKWNGTKVDNCENPINDTMAIARCRRFYTSNKPISIYRCQNGKWSPEYESCTPDCGTENVGDTRESEIMYQYPWVVAIYNGTKQICGGTILSQRHILSAASCFTNTSGGPLNHSDCTIVSGKHYRDLNKIEESAQTSKIESIKIPSDYRGKSQKYRDNLVLVKLDKELQLTLEVQPVCVDWENSYEDFDFSEDDDTKGIVTSWINTPSGTALKRLMVPYSTTTNCHEDLPADFVKDVLSSDRICTGFEDEEIDVSSVINGAGLFFKSDSKKFYIRGVVNIKTKWIHNCNSTDYVIYSKVSRILDMLNEEVNIIKQE